MLMFVTSLVFIFVEHFPYLYVGAVVQHQLLEGTHHKLAENADFALAAGFQGRGLLCSFRRRELHCNKITRLKRYHPPTLLPEYLFTLRGACT